MDSHNWHTPADGKGRLLQCDHCGAVSLIVQSSDITTLCLVGMVIDGETYWIEWGIRPASTVPWRCDDTVRIWHEETVKEIMGS